MLNMFESPVPKQPSDIYVAWIQGNDPTDEAGWHAIETSQGVGEMKFYFDGL